MTREKLAIQMLGLCEASIAVSSESRNGDIGEFYSDLFVQLGKEMKKNEHVSDADLSALWAETQSLVDMSIYPWSPREYAEVGRRLDYYRQRVV